MTKKLLALVLFFAATPSWATWTLAHANTCNTACTSGASTCAVTVTSTTSGNLLVGIVLMGSNVTVSSMTGGSSTHCPTCAGGTVGSGWTDAGYVTSATGGVTSVTITVSGAVTGIWNACVLEYHSTIGAAYDTSNQSLTASCTTTCVAASITQSGSNDVVIVAGSCTNTCSTGGAGFVGSTPWTNPGVFPASDILGGALNRATYTAPSMQQGTAGTIQNFAIAFKEVAPPANTGKAVIL